MRARMFTAVRRAVSVRITAGARATPVTLRISGCAPVRRQFSTQGVPTETVEAEVVEDGEGPAAPDASAAPEDAGPQPKMKGKTEAHTFQAETSRILDIVANSLYTDKEVFLRELISNASDALEKARYLQQSGEDMVDPEQELEIEINLDPINNTI